MNNEYNYHCSSHLYIAYQNKGLYMYGSNDGTYGIIGNKVKSSTNVIYNKPIYFSTFIEPEIIDDVIRFDLIFKKLKNLVIFI